MMKRQNKFHSAALMLLAFVMAFTAMTAVSMAEETPMEPAPAEAPPQQPQLPYLKEADVAAVFAGAEAQPAPAPEVPETPSAPANDAAPENQPPARQEPGKLDTIWIFYTDGTFDQYAEIDNAFRYFSNGTYFFRDGGDFHISTDGEEDLIVINRTHKYSAETKEIAEYESSHEYRLGTLGYRQIYAPDDQKKISAIFGDDRTEEYTDETGVTRYLDTFWIFYGDSAFDQYVFLNDDITLFSTGSYSFDEIGDFHFQMEDANHGTITLQFDRTMDTLSPKEKTCDLNSLGLTCLYERFLESEMDRTPPPKPE